MQVAERKAQRENIKMKMLTSAEIQMADMQWQQALMEQAAQMGMDPTQLQQQMPEAPPVVAVDDFDIHAKHVEVHNTFRMSQEYETLPPEIKAQFDAHVKKHEEMMQQQQMQQFIQQIPPAEAGAQLPTDQGPGATMSGNGQVPDMTPTPGA